MRSWLQISSGRGPAECCWVVARLCRYLLEEAQKEGISIELIEQKEGNAPLTMRSALLALEHSRSAEQFLLRWEGTVLWVGKSMFRPKHLRKNWFVSVTSYQPVESVEPVMSALRYETMRSSGPGGQHANKTDSAVRVTDTVTGISAVAREERSQHLNKKLALARLQKQIKAMNSDEQVNLQHSRWQQHNRLERGNPIRTFYGPKFQPKP